MNMPAVMAMSHTRTFSSAPRAVPINRPMRQVAAERRLKRITLHLLIPVCSRIEKSPGE